MTSRKPPTNEAPTATFSPEQLSALLNEVTESRKLLAAQMIELSTLKAEMAAKPAANGKGDVSAKNDWACIKAFKKLGITATPRVDTFTFNIWLSKGFRAKEGSKSVRVNNLRLFHKSQVRPLTAEEKAGLQAENDAAVRRHKADVVQLNPQ